jgi:antitoxin component YwqK of YwqJK toxin-antitoxin module
MARDIVPKRMLGILFFLAIVGGVVLAFLWNSGVTLDELEFRNGLAYRKGSKSLYTGSMVDYFKQTGNQKKRIHMQGSFTLGRRNGKWIINKWNGEQEVIAYNMGKRSGVSTTYYTQGRVREERTYQNDLLEGPSTFWQPNGEVIRTVFYKEGRITEVPQEGGEAYSKGLGWWKDVATAMRKFTE